MTSRLSPTCLDRLRFALAVVPLALVCSHSSPIHAASTETLIAPTGEVAGDFFGDAVGAAGDVNGDGYADIIVGARTNDTAGPDAGRAYVFHGGPAADDTPDLILTGEAYDYFGCSVGTAGDVNGDGYADLIVGAELRNSQIGAAYVYFGGPMADATPDLTLTGTAPGEHFGSSVGTAGDIDGDGYADLIVGAIHGDPLITRAGLAYVYYGGPMADETPDLILSGEGMYDEFGVSVGTAGDVNGDGFSDIIVGAHYNDATGTDAGRAYVFYGGPAPDATPDLYLNALGMNNHFGGSVGTARDVNGDGFADVVVGASRNDLGGTDAGAAYVFYGGLVPDATADLTFIGKMAYDLFGTSVGAAGDVNGDGVADLVISASGVVYAFFGGTSPDTTADVVFRGGGGFGGSVGTAGDVNGDGFADLVIGAAYDDANGTNAGRVFVNAVYPYRVLSPNGGEQWVIGKTETVRWKGHDPADVAFSPDGGLTYSTLLRGVGGAVENEQSIVVPATTTENALIRLTYHGEIPKHSNSDASDAVFSIVAPADPPPSACRLDIVVAGEAANDWLGESVATAGDVNGDGFADIIVGAKQGLGSSGKAYVHYGGAELDAVADLTFVGEMADDRFGTSVATAGDVDGDGYADLVVGAPWSDAGGTSSGRAYVYLGGPGADATADLILTGGVGERLGTSVGAAGDVNGDGFADLIVGAPFDDSGGTDAGAAYLYYGGPAADATIDLAFTGENAGDTFGFSVGTAGDVNGDGFADLLVGAAESDAAGPNAGAVYVYYGGPAIDATAELILTGEAADDQFGNPVATAGDVNGDGFSDLIVGARYNDAAGTDAGRAYVYYGGPAADATADLAFTGEAADDYFGSAVGTAGDVNGDGFADLAVGATAAGAGSAGRLYVYYGGPSADTVADLVLTGMAGEAFGTSVGTAGDVRGDGFGDLIIGAPVNATGGTFAGAAYVYDCNRHFVLSPNGGETWNVGSTETVSWLGAEPVDVSLSVDGGATYAPLRSGVGGQELNVLSLVVPHQPTRFARIRIVPTNASLGGLDESDSLYTIEASITLLSFRATSRDGGTAAVLVSWQTEPGPEQLAGYRLEKTTTDGSSWHTLVNETKDTAYLDLHPEGETVYRLTAINGLGAEYVLGETSLGVITPLKAWPLPYRGGELRISFATLGGLGSGLGAAEVALYDAGGRRVRTIAKGDFPAGYHSVGWDGVDDQGRVVSSGIYFLRVNTAGNVRTQKLVVVR